MNWTAFGQVLGATVLAVLWVLVLLWWARFTMKGELLWAWVTGFIFWLGFAIAVGVGLVI